MDAGKLVCIVLRNSMHNLVQQHEETQMKLFKIKVGGKTHYFDKKLDAKLFCIQNGGQVKLGPDHWRSSLPNHPKSHFGTKDAR